VLLDVGDGALSKDDSERVAVDVTENLRKG
jgi:hypothetical protein